jgi:hypothetical protein
MLELRVHNQYYDPYYGSGYYSGGGGGLSIGALILIFIAVFALVFIGIFLYRRYRSGQFGGGDPNYQPMAGPGPAPGYQGM